MSITYDSIKENVMPSLDLDYTDTEVIAKYNLLKNANSAQRYIRSILHRYLPKLPINLSQNVLKTVTGKLLEDIAYYAWPSDYLRFMQLWVSYTAAITETNLGKPVTRMGQSQFVVYNLDQAASTQNPKFDLVDGGWELRPMPTADQDDGYQLQYAYKMAEISASQPSLLSDNLENALYFKTIELTASLGMNRSDLVGLYSRLFSEEIQGLLGFEFTPSGREK